MCPNNECVWVQTTVEAFKIPNWSMRNVCLAWNDIRTEVCHANLPLSVKLVPELCNFGAKIGSCLANMSIQDIGMYSACCQTIWKSKCTHYHGVYNLRGEFHMSLLSHDTRFCPADAQIRQKMTHLARCAQIISVCEFRVLQKHFNVIIDSWGRLVKPGMVSSRNFVMQIHRYL